MVKTRHGNGYENHEVGHPIRIKIQISRAFSSITRPMPITLNYFVSLKCRRTWLLCMTWIPLVFCCVYLSAPLLYIFLFMFILWIFGIFIFIFNLFPVDFKYCYIFIFSHFLWTSIVTISLSFLYPLCRRLRSYQKSSTYCSGTSYI